MPSFTILIQSLHSTCAQQSQHSDSIRGPQLGRAASRSCPPTLAMPGRSGAARPGPAAPHINLTGPPVKLMLTRSYTDLLQPDPLLSQLVKAAPQSCLAGGKSTRYYESVATVGLLPTLQPDPLLSQLVKNCSWRHPPAMMRLSW